MYSTTAYLYQQRTRVLLIDTGDGSTFTYRWDPVYAKKLTLNKGVDNVILFEFINQEQKPVNITGSTFVFRAISQNGDKLLVEQPLVTLSANTGRAKVTLSTADLLAIEAQPASYSLSRTQLGGLTEAVFVDAQAGARADIDIMDSVLPQFVPSSELTIPTIEGSDQFQYDGTGLNGYTGGNPYWFGNGNGGMWNSYWDTEWYSSFIEPRGPVTTIQMTLIGYSGTIKIQGAENYQSIWYNVSESTTHFNETKTIHKTVIGWHPLLRLCFNNSVLATPLVPSMPALAYAFCTDGVLSSIVVQNGGSGYIAPPKINVIGNGAGATAEAVMSNTYGPGDPGPLGVGYGSVVAINVTNGGSGYWPVPSAAVNAQAYPVPPAQQGAIILISTGYTIDLVYR